MNNEKWKPVVGYEGLYDVSNYGRIKSKKRSGTRGGIIRPKTRRGYFCVDLCKQDKRKTVDVHRLVAEAFIPNPKGKPQVNHKDEDKKNNVVENLEWCTCAYNINYGTAIKRMVTTQEKRRTPFIDLETGEVYKSRTEYANEKGISRGYVSNLLAGRRKSPHYHIKPLD